MVEAKCKGSITAPGIEKFMTEDGMVFTMVGTQNDLLCAMHEQIDKIQAIATRTKVMMTEQEYVYVYDNKWTSISGDSVKAIACSLSKAAKDSTVVNVQVSSGGIIRPHKHDRRETVYVIEGTYIDPVTKKKYGPGDVQMIPPNTMHGLESDYCLLTVVWKPAYASEPAQ